MDFLKRNKNLLIAAAVIAIVVITIYFVVFNVVLFRVLSTAPDNNGSINLGQSAVIFNFTKDIEAVDMKSQVASSKDILISSDVNKNKLTVYVKNINKNEAYSIELKNIKSKSGEVIASYKLNFKGKYVEAKQLNQETLKTLEKQTDSNLNPGLEDPVTKLLPKRTSEYSMNFILYQDPSQKGKYVRIETVLFIPDYELDNNALIIDYKNKALKYLKDNNINPNDYVIVWYPQKAAEL